jgi:hypothetical protein
MKEKLMAAAIGTAALLAGAAPAHAQWASPTGAELLGQTVRVSMAGGVTNTLHFQPDGTLRIGTDTAQNVAQGRWFVQNQMLCLQLGADARECFPYQTAFQAQQPVNLTSDCGLATQWTALATNQPPMPMQPQPQQRRAGERG